MGTSDSQAQFMGLPEAVSPEVKKWAPVFDFDSDSCWPAPAVSSDGTMNLGLQDTGSRTGGCRDENQLNAANTYSRTVSIISRGGPVYSVYMYALYFEKDQGLSGSPAIGHRHDWEYALVWTNNGVLTHASFSAHGEVKTIAKEALCFETGKENTVKVVYHRDAGTRSFRPAKADEANKPAENPKGWFTPTLVEWGLMQGPTQRAGNVFVTNERLRNLFNGFDYGNANCSFNDNNFPTQIAKNPPPGYPGSNDWYSAATGTSVPQEPPFLVARWLVLKGDRNADRDNREVNLQPNQRARIVVYLPDELRSNFKFNLKHDKRGADDRGRTGIIGHGDVVEGNAQDWPSFGNRIYLGERQFRNMDESTFWPRFPYGFYVDLVRM